jgi:TatD DNase family protein
VRLRDKSTESTIEEVSVLSYVDSHLHLADPGYEGQVEQVIEDAHRNNVALLLSNATDYETSIKTIALAKRYSTRVLAAIGVHPSTATNSTEYHLDKFQQLIHENSDTVKAIGEVGLDGKYTQDPALKSRQAEVFRFFLALAERERLPVVVHSRLAVDEVLEELSRFDLPKVLLHWYDGPTERLKVMKERGYLVSIGPAIFYSHRISEIAGNASLDNILTETDGPVKFRGIFEGKPTHPSFVVDVVRRLAKIKSLTTNEVREAVWRNFQELIPSVS